MANGSNLILGKVEVVAVVVGRIVVVRRDIKGSKRVSDEDDEVLSSEVIGDGNCIGWYLGISSVLNRRDDGFSVEVGMAILSLEDSVVVDPYRVPKRKESH